jgi:hypothetical protein
MPRRHLNRCDSSFVRNHYAAAQFSPLFGLAFQFLFFIPCAVSMNVDKQASIIYQNIISIAGAEAKKGFPTSTRVFVDCVATCAEYLGKKISSRSRAESVVPEKKLLFLFLPLMSLLCVARRNKKKPSTQAGFWLFY